MRKTDLHIHSKFSSDGELEVEEILKRLKDLNFVAASISDHDTFKAYPEAIEKGQQLGLEVIPNVELTAGLCGRETHILAPFIRFDSEEAKKIVRKLEESRLLLTERRLEKLKALGFEISLEEVLQRAGSSPPTGPLIARIVIEKYRKHPSIRPYLERKDPERSFYSDFFAAGRPAFVERIYVDVAEAMEVVRKAGGVPVLAHPGAYFNFMTLEKIAYLKEKGLEGIEVISSYHDRELEEYFRKIARQLDLVETAGSDFHGKVKPEIKLGDYYGDYEMVEKLKERRDV